MTGSLREVPYDHLDKHHDQGVLSMQQAFRDGDEEVYRLAESLERRCRLEKIRRWMARDQPGETEHRVSSAPRT